MQPTSTRSVVLCQLCGGCAQSPPPSDLCCSPTQDAAGSSRGVRGEKQQQQPKEGRVKCTGPWNKVLAWRKIVERMKSVEGEAYWPGHASVAPGWLRKLVSNVWQTFTAGWAAAPGSNQQLYLVIKNKREGKKQGAASNYILTSNGCGTSAWEPFEVWLILISYESIVENEKP